MDQSHQGAGVGRIVVGLALDYFRWTQLVPMLMAWTFLLLMVGALLLTSFQQQSFGLIERGIGLYERFAGPLEALPDPADPNPSKSVPDQSEAAEPADEVDPDEIDSDKADPGDTSPAAGRDAPPASDTTAAPTANGAVHFTDEDIMPVVLRAWAILALAGWLLGMLRTTLFGPREPVAFRKKLLWAGAAAALCSALMLFAWQFGTEPFQGGPLGWILLFTGVPFVVWLVSAWSLGVGHFCERMKGVLYGEAI